MERRLLVKTYEGTKLSFWSSDEIQFYRKNVKVRADELLPGDYIVHDGKMYRVRSVSPEV